MNTRYLAEAMLMAATGIATCALALPPRMDVEQLDTDEDGFVSREEFLSGFDRFPGPDEILQQIDANGDGYLDTSEVEAHRAHRPAPGVGLLGLPDDNQDGLVSEQEFLDNAPSRTRDAGDLFRKIDSNSDGYLDPDELSKVRPAPPPASWR